jgi:SNF2 family DNA or RNA helicase
VEAQAIDRAHRLGRTEKVLAYRTIARGTIEEKVLELQEEKRELVRSVLGEGGALLRQLTREDLEGLLG